MNPSRWKALIFDVDGTLYRQSPLRRRILWRLCCAFLKSPKEGRRTIRVLRAYRRAQELLRGANAPSSDIAAAQLQLAAAWSRTDMASARTIVEFWMRRNPLDLVARLGRKGTLELLQAARNKGLLVAALSDYPAREKLAAMGIEPLFDAVVSAQDEEVQRFKPDPRGLQIVLERLAVAAGEALYIGDRPEVDAMAASRAGMACAIVGAAPGSAGGDWMRIRDFRQLAAALGLDLTASREADRTRLTLRPTRELR